MIRMVPIFSQQRKLLYSKSNSFPLLSCITLDQIFGARPQTDAFSAISSILDDLRAPLRPRSLSEPRRQLHVFLRKCDANYTHSPSRTATPTTRVPAPVAITPRYVMVGPLLGVGCPAAVGFVNRVIVSLGAKSPGRMMTARRNSIGDLAR